MRSGATIFSTLDDVKAWRERNRTYALVAAVLFPLLCLFLAWVLFTGRAS